MDESFMGGSTGHVGALASETKESILDEELEKLNDLKFQLKEENANYLTQHGDFHEILDDFVGEIFRQKPKDILGFGANYFNKRVKATGAAEEMKSSARGKLKPLVLCGPSGAGKGELIKSLVEAYPRHFSYSVSHTTRPPRPDEEDGVRYWFCSQDQMKLDIDKGRYFEHAYIQGAYYGTTYQAIEDTQANDKVCIIDVDSQGVQNIKSSDLACTYMFISPSAIEDLEENLKKRSYETEESINKRLGQARGEIAFGMEKGNFDAVVVVANAEQSFEDAINLISEWYPMLSFEEEEAEGKEGGDEGKDEK